jgi:hypothetical protein
MEEIPSPLRRGRTHRKDHGGGERVPQPNEKDAEREGQALRRGQPGEETRPLNGLPEFKP